MSLNSRIKKFYDQSTPLWLDVWGEHMHHGHYGPAGDEKKERVQAQLDMIETILEWGGVDSASRIFDAGCGVGGSSRYLAKRFNAEALGVTLSPVQVKNGNRYSELVNLKDQVRLECRDMMSISAADGEFDFIWSMESAEHIADKQKLFDLFYERLKPGGKIVMATWCYRELPPALSPAENKLLNKVYDLYHLPPMVPISSLEEMAQRSGFKNIKTADWSRAVAPFWQTVIESALTWQGISGLLRAGAGTLKGAWAMRYMKRGFKMNLIKFGVLSCEK